MAYTLYQTTGVSDISYTGADDGFTQELWGSAPGSESQSFTVGVGDDGQVRVLFLTEPDVPNSNCWEGGTDEVCGYSVSVQAAGIRGQMQAVQLDNTGALVEAGPLGDSATFDSSTVVINYETPGWASQSVSYRYGAILVLTSAEAEDTITVRYGGETLDSLSITQDFLCVDTPTSISSDETVSSPDISVGAVNIDLDSVASSESVSSPALTVGGVSVDLDSVASSESVSSPDISVGAVEIDLDSITSAEAVSSPAITVGSVEMRLDDISSSEAVGSPALTPGAVSVTLESVASSESVGSPTLTPGAVTLSLDSITSDEGVGSPTISTTVDLSITSITTAEALGSPAVTQTSGQTIELDSITSAESVSSPAVTGGNLILGVVKHYNSHATPPKKSAIIKPKGSPVRRDPVLPDKVTKLAPRILRPRPSGIAAKRPSVKYAVKPPSRTPTAPTRR